MIAILKKKKKKSQLITTRIKPYISHFRLLKMFWKKKIRLSSVPYGAENMVHLVQSLQQDLMLDDWKAENTHKCLSLCFLEIFMDLFGLWSKKKGGGGITAVFFCLFHYKSLHGLVFLEHPISHTLAYRNLFPFSH